ncbi:MAG: FAD-binding protein [Candidatus Lokiarchaeota archaeon]|nr:FAD-binding protein [Candidatus Lokiarchaeota archaeon]
MTDMNKIFKKLSKIVGDKYVTTQKPLLLPYGRDQHWKFVEPQLPAIVVKPSNADEVCEILKIANENKVPIVPRSRGVNVRGLCIPTNPGSIVVDLHRMNRIIEINEDMHTATIEPGVTHGAFAIAVRKKGLRPCIPGAPATGSILTNYLLKGVYHTNAGDGIDHVLSADIALPSGKIIKLGAQAFPNAGPHFRFTSGPDLIGMFSTLPGTMGICTKMTVKLFPLPEHEVWFQLAYKDIAEAIKPIPKLMWNNIPSVMWVLGEYTVIKLIAKKKEQHEKLRGSFPGDWIIPITIEGDERVVNAKAELAEEIINKESKPLTKATPIPPPINFVKEFKYARNVLGFLRDGSYHALAFWGSLDKYPQYVKMLKDNAEKAGYERKNADLIAAPVAGFWGQACYYEAEVPYTAASDESVKMVKDFHYASLKDLLKIGIYGWFRPFLNPMKLVIEDLDEYGKMMKKLHKLVDPNEIMNPGKVFPKTKELT